MMSGDGRPGMRRFVSCEDDDTPVLRDDEIILYTLQKVGVAYRREDAIIEELKLFVTSSRIILIGVTIAADFDVSYVTLHAVTRDPASYAKPCLYCQLDYEEEEDEEEVECLLYPKSEMFLVPETLSDLKAMFDAFSQAALMNPDPPEDGEEEGDDELIYNQEEVALGAEQARVLSHLETVFHVPEDIKAENDLSSNFEDAPDA
jgi:Regulator of volume decrease after cellular swelling